MLKKKFKINALLLRSLVLLMLAIFCQATRCLRSRADWQSKALDCHVACLSVCLVQRVGDVPVSEQKRSLQHAVTYLLTRPSDLARVSVWFIMIVWRYLCFYFSSRSIVRIYIVKNVTVQLQVLSLAVHSDTFAIWHLASCFSCCCCSSFLR